MVDIQLSVGLLERLGEYGWRERVSTIHGLPEAVFRGDPASSIVAIVLDIPLAGCFLAIERVPKNLAIEPLAVSQIGKGAGIHSNRGSTADSILVIVGLDLLLEVIKEDSPIIVLAIEIVSGGCRL